MDESNKNSIESIDRLAQGFFISLIFCSLMSDSYITINNFIKNDYIKKKINYFNKIYKVIVCLTFNNYKDDNEGNIIIEENSKSNIVDLDNDSNEYNNKSKNPFIDYNSDYEESIKETDEKEHSDQLAIIKKEEIYKEEHSDQLAIIKKEENYKEENSDQLVIIKKEENYKEEHSDKLVIIKKEENSDKLAIIKKEENLEINKNYVEKNEKLDNKQKYIKKIDSDKEKQENFERNEKIEDELIIENKNINEINNLKDIKTSKKKTIKNEKNNIKEIILKNPIKTKKTKN